MQEDMKNSDSLFVLVLIGFGPVACSKTRSKLIDKMGEYPDGSRFHIYSVDMV